MVLMVCSGSSPLARGLPGGRWRASRTRGIIPARAGFTCLCVCSFRVSWDHPRSRGVYSGRIYMCSGPQGSSPLARGLPPPNPPTHLRDRIIPARAGFTPLGVTGPRISSDHPRSRGVYAVRPPAGARIQGSSPLARGLPPGPRPGQVDRRIIPARAGFTRVRFLPKWAGPDHPRSRGVY